MRNKVGLVLAWTGATVASVLIASAAVGGVGDQVTDRPAGLPDAALQVVGTTGAAPTSATPQIGPPPGGTALGSDVTADSTQSGGSALETTTPTSADTGDDQTSAPPTTAAADTSSPEPTTTSPPDETQEPWTVTEHELVGGVVVLRSRPGQVELLGATPNPGFSVEVEKAGPSSVEVEFKGSHYEASFHAEWRDGHLDVDTGESSDD